MKYRLTHLGFLRVVMICVALMMISIIAVFGIYFATEKVLPKGSVTVGDTEVSYKVSVATEGKYTLKRALVEVLFYNAAGEVILTRAEVVHGEEVVSGSVEKPEGYDQVGFVLKKYSLNNIYEIIVMCLCAVVLISALTYFGFSFFFKKEDDPKKTTEKSE